MSGDLSDSITYIVTDNFNVLCFVNSDNVNAVSLISTKVPPNTHWKDTIVKDIKELLGESVLISHNVFKIVRAWIPEAGNTERYIINVIIIVKVSSEFKSLFRIPTNGRFANLKWLNERDLMRFHNLHAVSTPYLMENFPKMNAEATYLNTLPAGIYACNMFLEVTSEIIKDTDSVMMDLLIAESPLYASIKLIYMEFLKMIYPNVFMSCGYFTNIVLRLGFNKHDAVHLFNAADARNRHFISFGEFMAFVAAVEPTAKHVGNTARARAFLIFRFLNRNNDGNLTLKDLKELVIMLRKNQHLAIDNASIEKELKDTALALNITPTHSISCQEFVKYVEELRVCGVAKIFRASNSILSLINATNRNSIALKTKDQLPTFNFIPSSVIRAIKDTVKWDIATHSVFVSKSGTRVCTEPLFNFEICSEAELASATITKLSRQLSLDNCSSNFVCNELMDNIRELAVTNVIRSGNRGNRNRDYSWGNINSNTLAQKIIAAAQLARNILQNEPRLLRIKPPIYILGDFHGNFGDVLYFERTFWPINPHFNSAKMICLGDYVDRGWHSVEVAIYLICSKVLYPEKFYLVRGNHEIRDVQKMYTFFSECTGKFGENTGKQVWEAVNTVFDSMPLAAVIDDKIFCCHGGIPPPWLCPRIDAINQIPVPLPDPDLKSPLAWDLLWNDPIKDRDINEDMAIEMAANNGFASNLKRGTAHVFNCAATMHFLKTNNLTHIIRAHELAIAGFTVFHKGKVMTVFSSSRYNGCNNEAACILAENFRMQVIRLNPSNFDL